MASNVGDFKLASTAAGFTLGFGFLVVWNAIVQTRAVRSPLRSVYVYMVWGEIAANLMIGILGWLFLDGTLKPSVPLLFGILLLWVFEVQLLMQIIINRIAVVLDDRRLVWRLKWGTAAIITCIEIAVFIIWIPAHLDPPPIPLFVTINKYWDRTSKVLILLVDAGLNYFFLRVVKSRLVNYHGLTKYAPLVSFNAKLMVVSIAMDLMLICLMSLKNQVVYVQFHPVAYMVKLNIEMTMASLITKLAKGSVADRNNEFMMESTSHNHTAQNHTAHNHTAHNHAHDGTTGTGVTTSASAKIRRGTRDLERDFDGIKTHTEVDIRVESVPKDYPRDGSLSTDDGFDKRSKKRQMGGSEDELPLKPYEVPRKDWS